MVCSGGLKRAYSEGYTILSLRLFWAAFLKEACMKGFKNFDTICSSRTVCTVPYRTVRTVHDNTV